MHPFVRFYLVTTSNFWKNDTLKILKNKKVKFIFFSFLISYHRHSRVFMEPATNLLNLSTLVAVNIY